MTFSLLTTKKKARDRSLRQSEYLEKVVRRAFSSGVPDTSFHKVQVAPKARLELAALLDAVESC